MNIEEKNQADAIRKAGKVLGHFHLRDGSRDTGGDPPPVKPIVKREGGRLPMRFVIESFTDGVK